MTTSRHLCCQGNAPTLGENILLIYWCFHSANIFYLTLYIHIVKSVYCSHPMDAPWVHMSKILNELLYITADSK